MAEFKHFRLLSMLPVGETLDELAKCDDLWNQHKDRTEGEASPHREIDDIFVRFLAPEHLANKAAYLGPHIGVWYPAIKRMPSIRPICLWLMHGLKAVSLGGVLITRIPPGAQVYPHHDRGRWHASYFNAKVYVVLQGNAQCINYAEGGDEVIMKTGECWLFNNQVEHSVVNNGDAARISLIVAMRVE